MTTTTIHACDGGCGRDIDALNDIPPVDNVTVHSTVVQDFTDGNWRGYCVDCSRQLFPASWSNPIPTHIKGIDHAGDGMDEGNQYAATFPLYLDADNPEQASDRAMAFRGAVCSDDVDAVEKLGFFWHLHDHDRC